MSLIAERYAQALVSLATEEKAVDEYQSELSSIVEAYESQNDLKTFLLDPRSTIATKKDVLKQIYGAAARPNILHFLFLILEKGRIEELPHIYREYVKAADQMQGILNLTITAAMPLDPEQIEEICEKFRIQFHSVSVKATIKIDQSMIGGIKVFVGDQLFDGTLQGKLSRLQSVLSGKQSQTK